ncbi:MAG: PQQ-binding-like beta-propeller repeat protein [Verrucomicrobiota bacterium]
MKSQTATAFRWMSAALLMLPAVLPAAPTVAASAADWPFYRGPNGDGETKAGVGKPWDSAGPKEVWKVGASAGFSSLTVSGGLATTLVTRDFEGSPTEYCVALDAATGKERWSAPLKIAKYQGGGDSGANDNGGGDGPRSTPTLAEGKVYVYGSNLDLYCFDAKTGKPDWTVDVLKEYKGKNIAWSNATSPVVEGDLVIVAGGGKGSTFLAFNKRSGALKWKTGDDVITHATPTPAVIHGEPQLIFFMKSGLVSLSPKNGKELWKQDFPFKVSTAASPVVSEDVVYCSAGYGVGCASYEVKKAGLSYETHELWRKEGDELANHWSTPICREGFLYGVFGFKKYGSAPVKCVNIRTGEVKWSKDGFGPGNVILASDKLLALSDKGELVLIDAKPDDYKELARADVLDGKCWSTPTLAGGFIFARSTKQAACFAVAP